MLQVIDIVEDNMADEPIDLCCLWCTPILDLIDFTIPEVLVNLNFRYQQTKVSHRYGDDLDNILLEL